MKDQNSIEVKNLKKNFKIYLDKSESIKEKLIFFNRNRYEERQILKGISFEVKRGEAIGLVGHNGCGKSTTLKLLTKIMYPDSGTVELRGRVSSLIELGAGFHPDMSGRENIYINASIFGLSRKEIEAKMDDIIEFSELEDYIDNPVRTYSSGMYMRLAFSVAINVNADILLIDEILAVGDVNFQAKCFSKLHEIKRNGTTIVIVSHSMDQIEKICSRSIWINGLIQMDGDPREVHKAYLECMSELRRKQVEKEEGRKASTLEVSNDNVANEETQKSDNDKKSRRGTGEARLTRIRCLNEARDNKSFYKENETIVFELEYKCSRKIEKAVFGLCFIREDGVRCFGCNSRNSGGKYKDIDGTGKVYLELPQNKLLNGVYYADGTIESENGETIDYFDNATKFEVKTKYKISGVAWLEHEWML